VLVLGSAMAGPSLWMGFSLGPSGAAEAHFA
jgi:hypothetical protein